MARRKPHRPVFSLFSFQDIITSVTGVILLTTLLLTLSLVQQALTAPTSAPQVDASIEREIEAAEQELRQLTQELQRNQRRLEDLETVAAGGIETTVEALEQEVERLQKTWSRLTAQEQAIQTEKEKLQLENQKLEPQREELAQLRRDAAATRAKIESLRKANRLIYNPAVGSNKTAWLIDLSAERMLVAQLGRKAPPERFTPPSTLGRMPEFERWLKRRDPRTDYFVLLVRPDAIEIFRK